MIHASTHHTRYPHSLWSTILIPCSSIGRGSVLSTSARNGRCGSAVCANARISGFRGLLAVAALFVGYALSRSAVSTASFVAFVAVAGALGGKVGERVQWRLQARSFERRCLPKYASMLYVLDSSGFRIQNGDTDLHIGWSAFDRWTESDEFLLLFTGPAVGYYLPKQAASPGDLPRALELLSRSIP